MKAINTEVSQVKREKRARSIAAMGLVRRNGDHFEVTTPSLKGQAKTFTVDKNDSGSVRCTCPDFLEEIALDGTFRCEHILAVKFHLTERSTKSADLRPADAVSADQTSASESLLPMSDEQGTERVNSIVETDGPDSMQIQSLAPLANTKGEIEMKQETLIDPEIEVIETEVESSEPNNVLDFSTTLKELRRNVDPKLVKQREGWRDRNGRVQMVDYVEWHTVADILDETAPNWTHTVKDIRPIGDIMTVTAAITIDGITREGVGTGLANSEMGIKKAEHDALKRAAVKFGIARDLYKKESDVIEREGGSFTDNNNDDGFPSNPMASSLADQVTAKQLGMIKAIAREIGIDADEECRSLLQCSSDELSKRAASQFIKHLQDIQRRAQPPAQVPFRRAS